MGEFYVYQTTFPMDFTIADKFGIDAVKDTYDRAFNEWKNNYQYLTELVLVLNQKCWQKFEDGESELSKLYADLYYKTRDYALDHLTGEQLRYYFEMTD